MILEDYHNVAFVIASILIAILTAYVAMATSSRIPSRTGWRRWNWILISSICLGGGIWSMHFVAMLGYVLPIPVNYNVLLTIASLILPMVVAVPGFYLAFQDRELSWPRLSAIGTIYGIAIAGMHYTGMAAMDMEAEITWDMAYVVLSIMVAIVTSTIAIKASFIQLSFIPAILGSLLMGAAISGMHYTAMCAVTVVGKPELALIPHAASVTRAQLGVGVTVLAFVVLLLGFISATYDRRVH